MSISGAMFAGVSGLRAQSTNMGIISDNIANANTVGYKGSKAQFETLVTSGATSTSYNPGGVRPHPSMMVAAQGLLNSSSSKTDIGIEGAGFFACTNAVNVRSDGTIPGSVERNFTRAGSFSISKDGNLINSANYTLLGVPTDSKGVPNVSNPSIMALQPVSIGTVAGSSSPTTELKISANLPAIHRAPSKISLAGTLNTSTTTPAGGTLIGAAPQPATDWTVYSSSGKPYAMAIQLRKIAPTTPAAPAVAVPPGTPHVYEVLAVTMTGLPGSSPPDPPVANLVLGTITVSTRNEPTIFTAGASVSFADGTTFQPTFDVAQLKSGTADRLGRFEVDSEQISSVVYDTLGVPHNLTLEFSRNEQNDPVTGIIDLEPSGPRAWSVKIVDMTIAGTGAPSVDFARIPAGGPGGFPIYLNGRAANTRLTATDGSFVNFTRRGEMASNAPTSLPSLPMATGAENFGGPTFTLNLGTPGTLNGISSQSNEFSFGFIRQNGVPYGSRNGVDIDKDGLVRLTFTNGQSLPVFKLPVVTFANPNMLEAKSGNVWAESSESGSALANFSGKGPSGRISPASLEASTVDIATEFTNMIITQRSYAANSRSITTSDEMLQETLNMKR